MKPETTFANLLVPLDGSRLAEAVLPAVRAIASAFRSRVTLLHVLERRPPATVHGDRHLVTVPEATEYLEDVAASLRAAGIEVETHVHDAPEGDLPRSLVEHAEEFEPDVIVLCAHGEGGLRGLLFGSIAQQVLQRGSRPVLLIQPTATGGAPDFSPARILAPLDGKTEHEGALGASSELARAFGAEIELVYTVPTLGTLSGKEAATGVLLPAATRAILDLNEEDARLYLERIARNLRAGGTTVQATVLRGETVQTLVRHAKRVGADLIAMTSHGRTGLDALFGGSVAPRITSESRIPILLVRAPDR